MNQFELARLKAEKRKESRPVLTLPKKEPEIRDAEPREPKPKAPKQKSNEIEVTVYANGQEFAFTFRANITGGLMASQINYAYLKDLLKQGLGRVLGAVE